MRSNTRCGTCACVLLTVVGVQAVGGLLISLVVRYGDALLKGFATGLAIIVTTADTPECTAPITK